MKRVVSVSLGSSKRDKKVEVELCGEQFSLERIGVDGDYRRFRDTLLSLDGKVDALGLGGTNLGVWAKGRLYRFREITRLVAGVKQTPVVDGSGVKNSLEREVIRILDEEKVVDLEARRVLVTCGVDRFGMSQELDQRCRQMVFGDLMFNLGLPFALRSYRTHQALAGLLLPVVVQLPYRWLYPTGEKQEETKPRWQRWFSWADAIVGDWHTIGPYMPPRLENKTVVTNTTTEQDVELLRQRGVSLLVTTFPALEGRSFATNVLEGVLLVLAGKPRHEMRPDDYLEQAHRMGWHPGIQRLN